MRETPIEWSKYTTASMAVKVISAKPPLPLLSVLMRTYYSERTNVARGLFFDSSKIKVGKQSIQNRLTAFCSDT
jgi:hypothetical protein